LLQQIDLTILANIQKHNVVSYFLSWLTIPTKENMIDDQFADEHLFSISTQTPWFFDIENYLTTGKCRVSEIPAHMI
jgi:hypothetical protein